MSSDIFIPLGVVLSHPMSFSIKAALDGCMENAVEEVKSPNPDWDYIQGELRPILLCKFGNRATWRVVDIARSIYTNKSAPYGEVFELHISCGGPFRQWLLQWLEDHNFDYTID